MTQPTIPGFREVPRTGAVSYTHLDVYKRQAFELQDDGSLLLALGAKQAVGTLGTVTPQDVLRFVPSSIGDNTSGTFSLWVDGSTVGLAAAGEKIDALALTADGRIAIGVTGALSLSLIHI